VAAHRFSSAACARVLVVQALDPQQRPDSGHEFLAVDRLGQEVVGTGLQSLDALLPCVQRGHHHDRQRFEARARANRCADFVAVHPGHQYVEQHEIERTGVEAGKRLDTRRGNDDRMTLIGQDIIQQSRVGRDIVDNENCRALLRAFRHLRFPPQYGSGNYPAISRTVPINSFRFTGFGT
jgi:hypothetical protein